MVESVELIGKERILKFYPKETQYRSLVNVESQINACDKLHLHLDMNKAFIFDENGKQVY